MTNVAGDTKIKFGKKTYTIRADFKAISDLEDDFNDGTYGIIQRVGSSFRISHMARLTYHLLQSNHKDDEKVDSPEKIGPLIMKYGAPEFIGKLKDCIYGALNPNDPDDKGEVGNDPNQRETKKES